MSATGWLRLRKSGARVSLAHSLLIMIGATYLEVAIYMMILWESPTLAQYFGAALLGWACALLVYTRLQHRIQSAEAA
jgi:hypothetical protein